MRIIAGEARGRTLVAPKGMDTRPTLDRVRESLFSILLPYLPDAHVLDLFAGSGALGLEALSRGAASAVFVDKARAAQDAVAHNVAATRMEGRAALLRTDWRTALRRLAGQTRQFDLVFLDPPYQLAEAGDMLAALRDSGLLADGARVAYEHATDLPPEAPGWVTLDTRRYGETSITFLALPMEGEGDAHSALPRQL